jgi:hypothetical protein
MVAFLLFSSLVALVHGTTSAKDPRSGGRQFSVKLHKQLVPVRDAQHKIVAYKSAYFGTIFLGGPVPQEFSVVFDTGSGHVVLPSSECTSPTCLIHRRYSRKDSDYALDIDYNGQPVKMDEARDAITIAFGTGEVSGEFVQDKVCFPQNNDEDLLSEDAKVVSDNCVEMRVVAATEMSQEPFQSFSFDGVLGLGLDGLALAPEFSLFNRLVAQGKLGAPEFAVFLAGHEDDESEITFGGYNPEHLHGELTWAPVVMPDHGHWQVQILGVRAGGTRMPWCANVTAGCRAVVDTGTSLIAAPREIQSQLQDLLGTEIPDKQHGCKELASWTLEFDLMGGFTVEIASHELAHSPVLRPPLKDSDTNRTVCVPTIMPLALPEPLGPNLFILGEPVLRKIYTVYNWERKEIGFGKVPPEPQMESTLII